MARASPQGTSAADLTRCRARRATGWVALVDDDLKDTTREGLGGLRHHRLLARRAHPGEVLRAVADAADELGIDEWDVYAEKGAGRAARGAGRRAARQAGGRIVPERDHGPAGRPAGLVRPDAGRSGSRSPTCPTCSSTRTTVRAGCTASSSTTSPKGPSTATADDLRRLSPGLGAALVELPLRDAGCLLPSWEDLTALSEAARELGVPLHADGARIWESQPYWDKAARRDRRARRQRCTSRSTRGSRRLAGAALVGPEDVVEEARTWRRRMGGTLFHLTPFAVSALAGLRERLPADGGVRRVGAVAGRRADAARADGRAPTRRTPTRSWSSPRATPDAIRERKLAFMEREKIQPCGGWWEAPVPGIAMTEVAAHDAALEHDPAQVADWIAEVVRG